MSRWLMILNFIVRFAGCAVCRRWRWYSDVGFTNFNIFQLMVSRRGEENGSMRKKPQTESNKNFKSRWKKWGKSDGIFSV